MHDAGALCIAVSHVPITRVCPELTSARQRTRAVKGASNACCRAQDTSLQYSTGENNNRPTSTQELPYETTLMNIECQVTGRQRRPRPTDRRMAASPTIGMITVHKMIVAGPYVTVHMTFAGYFTGRLWNGHQVRPSGGECARRKERPFRPLQDFSQRRMLCPEPRCFLRARVLPLR